MARKIEVQIVGDSKSLERAFKRSGSAGQSFEKRVLGMSKKAAFALGSLGVGAGALGAKFTQMAGDAEEVRSKFQVVFGTQMPRMVKQLDAFSEATGASRYQLRQQTADLGALLVPLVGTQKEAAKLSLGFTKLATDLSSFNNVPVEEALLAIRSGLVGEAEPLRKFGVLLNEAAVKAEAYRSGIAKAGATLTEQQKVQARANLIMQQTKLAQGDAARTADSFTNQLRKLKNQASDTATDLGMKLLPIATTVLDKLNEWGPVIAQKVQPRLDALGRWADEHKQEFRDLFADIRDGAEQAARQLGNVGRNAETTADAMGGWDSAFKMILSGLLANKFAAVLKKLSGGQGMVGLLTKIKGLGPTIAIAVTIDLLVNEDHRRKLAKWAELLSEKVGLDDPRWFPVLGIFANKPRQKGVPTGGGALDTLIGGGAMGATAAGGLQLPTSFSSTHQTSGLPGFPAVDIFGRAGTPILAPENGRIVSIRPFNNDPDFYGMAIYYLGASGRTYYIKHIYDPSPLGSYRKGDVLGKIAAGTSGGPHVHLGVRNGPGIPIPISNAPSSGGGGGGGSTGGGGSSGALPPSTKVQPLIPARMRLALTRGEGTKNIGDDLTALRVMVAYLQKLLPKTKDIEKRIEITEALNGLRERIRELGKTGKKADISDAIDYVALKKKLTEQFRQGLEAARQRVLQARTAFGSAFAVLGDSLLQVFDAKTAQMLENIRAQVTGFNFSIGAGEETPAERLLRERREARIDADLAASLASATTAEARADAVAAIEERALEKQAALERAAADQALADARKRLEDERAVKRAGFADALADLQANWAKTNATTAQRTKELHELMAKFDVPFHDVGLLLGTAFSNGFLESLQVVFDRLGALARELNKVTPGQAAEAVITAGGSALAARSAALNAKYGLGLPSFQNGGVVPGVGPQLAVVHGGETITPAGRGGGPYYLVLPDGKVLAELVRKEDAIYHRANG